MLTPKNARGEHLLWLTPIVYMWLANITAPVQTIVIFNGGKFYLFSYFATAVIFLMIIALPYLLHEYFRENNNRSIVVSWLHILSSLIVMLGILVIITYTPTIDQEWRYYPIQRPDFVRWLVLNDIALGLFVTLILIQITYLIYGLGKLFQRGGSQNLPIPTDLELFNYNQPPTNINPAL
ncbi:MAG: hypothetical protein WCH78_13655 [Bacteroidota bacterium]